MTEDFSPKKQLETQKGGSGRKGKTAIGSGDDGDADYQSWSARESDPVAWRRPLTVVCDSNLLIRFGLGLMLEPVAQVVGDAACGRSAVELVRRVRPHLVILDVNLAVLNGVQVCTKILQDLPESKLVVFSDSFFISRYHTQLVRCGASAFCLKSSEPQVLVEAIQHVFLNQPYCDPRMAQLLCHDPTILMLDEELSEQEIEVLVRLDLRNDQIADELQMPVFAVEDNIENVLNKLKVGTRANAVLKAEQLGLKITPPNQEQRSSIADELAVAEKHAKEAIERWLKHSPNA
jgi:DNA-binding NarL/FixJ family response regulator